MSLKKVLVGMSGGVDSSVTAALLMEQGYEVAGVFVEAYNEPGCRTDEDKKDALQVALKLGIPFKVLDLRAEYKEKVVQYFLDEYKAGRTPNPDIVCNREVKFGLLYDYTVNNGFDYLATGHYARITNEHNLQQPIDKSKDQTYFLWQVAKEKLNRVLFPLGEITKLEVRARAKQLELPNANKPDSMGVCMLGELNVREFLKHHLGMREGEVWWKGKRVGSHQGLWFHTIGERGGWQVEARMQQADMPALYVVGKDMRNNRLVVGEREECYTNKIIITNFQAPIDESDKPLYLRIRNLGELTEIDTWNTERGTWQITTKTSIFAPAAGQSAVLYDERGMVVGGGIIAN